ncbi:MAG: hypothetical protein ACOYIP_04875 [Coriobacteriales bacterium]|jgi:flagellar motor protein MotB
MGCYEHEQELIERGEAQRGYAAMQFCAEIDAAANQLTVTRRPDYTKTLFAPENDEIYRELCRYIDMPAPRFYDKLPDQLEINGYTATDVYRTIKQNNWRIVDVDALAVYDMLVSLKTEPEIAERILNFHPSCAKSGACGNIF